MKINLETIQWFDKAGQDTYGKDLGLPVKTVGSQEEMLQNLESIAWGNFILYAKNRLSWYIKKFYPEHGKDWNDVARRGHGWYGQYNALITEAANKKAITQTVLPYCKAIFISYYLEQYYYNNVSKEIPMHFDRIITIFVAGHIPCGWQGIMPENLGYDTIDLNSGKILIY